MKRWRIILIVAGAVLLAGGASAFLLAPRSHQPPSFLPVAPNIVPVASPLASPAVTTVPRVQPVRVIIPAIGTNASVIPEGTDSTGALETPPLNERNVTGWWAGGSAPGQDGPAVIVGHVDSAASGPLVFWHLSELKHGDVIETEPGNLRFTVTGLQEVTKYQFPTQAVYGPTPGPQLRLITCGGAFDSGSGQYVDNIIVYATEL
jgi:sortase (surface protein transpeptidase)